MKKNNIALITALYNVKDANFYREIYFPVIKYSITRLFTLTMRSGGGYCEPIPMPEQIDGHMIRREISSPRLRSSRLTITRRLLMSMIIIG